MADAFLDADQIRAASFVRHVEIYDELGSTNNRAAELAGVSGVELPALVVARRQTAGRGRGHNIWWSADGALTFSILLNPLELGIAMASWPQLSLATAVAVCDALGKELDSPNKRRLAIKWPNDVMLDGGKICGILAESPGGAAPAKDRLVIGIGVNVNNSRRSAPHAAGPNVGALCDATTREHKLPVVLTNTLNAIRRRIDQLAANDRRLSTAWQQLCWLAELNVVVQANGKSISGKCLGIDDDGALVIEDVFETHRIFSGTVRVTHAPRRNVH